MKTGLFNKRMFPFLFFRSRKMIVSRKCFKLSFIKTLNLTFKTDEKINRFFPDCIFCR